MGGGTEDQHELVVVSDQSGPSSAVVCSFVQSQTGKEVDSGREFLDTLLPKKRVTRRLAAATAVARPHDNSRPGGQRATIAVTVDAAAACQPH